MILKQENSEPHLDKASHALAEIPLTPYIVRFIMESGACYDFDFTVRCEEEAIAEAKRVLNESLVEFEDGRIMVIKVRREDIHPKYYEAAEPILALDNKDEGIIAIKEKIKKDTEEYLKKMEHEHEKMMEGEQS